MGYLRYLLGIQILYAIVYTSTSPLVASENNDSSLASSTENNSSSLTSSTNNNDSSIGSPEENNNSSMTSSGQNDNTVMCVRDCMRICMNLDNATPKDCEGACRKGCQPLLARNEIGSLGNINSSDFLVPKFNKPSDKPD